MAVSVDHGIEYHLVYKTLSEQLLSSNLKFWPALRGELALKIYECQVEKEEEKRGTWDNVQAILLEVCW